MKKKKSLKTKFNILVYNLILRVLNFYKPLTKKIIGLKIFGRIISLDFDNTFSSNFPANLKFKFIQIGGNDGISFDNLYQNIIKRKSKGLILEPSPFYFDKLKSTYEGNENIILVRNAIFEKNQDVIIFELNEIGLSNHPKWAAGIGSLDKDHLLKLKVFEHEIREVKVEGITFNDLLKKYPNFYDVDYLQIDTEGYDYEILKTIDFDKFNASMVKFEYKNLSLKEKQLAENLMKRRFEIFVCDLDYVCLSKDLKLRVKF